jgi:hypothetical protein
VYRNGKLASDTVVFQIRTRCACPCTPKVVLPGCRPLSLDAAGALAVAAVVRGPLAEVVTATTGRRVRAEGAVRILLAVRHCQSLPR